MKAIINARIYDYLDYIENGYIIFDETIIEVGRMSNFKAKKLDEIIDVSNAFVMPGFICGHTHLYSAFARGMSVPFNPKSFKEILTQLWWKLDHYLDHDMIYYSGLSFGLEQVRNGSTTLIDHHASFHVKGSLRQLKKALVDRLGIRAILAFETSDRFDVDASIHENVELLKHYHSSNISGLFGLHASFTLSNETLRKVKEKISDKGIHIHVAESIKDEEDSLKKYGKTVVERLDDFHLINNKSILVHCTNASEKELDIIKKRDAYIAINVTSNMNNAVGLPNIKMMNDKGIKLIVGNDGLIPSMPLEYLNAYYSSHLQSKNPIGLSIEDIKKMILNSFEFASKMFRIKLGQIKETYVSDLIVVPYQEFTPIQKQNVFSHLFFGMFPSLKPIHVIANGNVIVKNYEVDENLNKDLNIAIEQAKKLWKIIEKEGNNLEFKD